MIPAKCSGGTCRLLGNTDNNVLPLKELAGNLATGQGLGKHLKVINRTVDATSPIRCGSYPKGSHVHWQSRRIVSLMEQLSIHPNAFFAFILYECIVVPLFIIKARISFIDALRVGITTTDRVPIYRTATPWSMAMESSRV